MNEERTKLISNLRSLLAGITFTQEEADYLKEFIQGSVHPTRKDDLIKSAIELCEVALRMPPPHTPSEIGLLALIEELKRIMQLLNG